MQKPRPSQGQFLHALLFAVLAGSLWLFRPLVGLVSAATLVALSMVIALLHQAWVAVCWRLELHGGRISRILGRRAFLVFGLGFGILFVARFLSIVPVALLTRGALGLSPVFRGVLVGLILIIAGVALDSVLRHFGLRRALGADHFDPSYRDGPLIKRGVYKYTNNAMYTMVLLSFYLPGLIWGSLDAIVLGLFHHLFVWVHYFCTERPDMKIIYGGGSERP